MILDSENTAIYKQLYRAAKAKLKLRIKVTEQIPIPDPEPKPELKPESDQPSSADDTVSPAYRGSYLNTVLNGPSLQPGEALPLPKFPTLSDSLQKAIDEIPARLDPYHPSAEDTSTRPAFYIDCNSCGNSIPAAHWHCSICEDGDYDLCQACVDAGVSCPGVNHWLIKRIVINGTVVHSTTETLAPASRHQPASPVMGAPTPEPQREPQSEPEAVVEGEAEESPLDTVVEEPQAEAEQEPEAMLRTCNACFEGNCEHYDFDRKLG